MLGGATFVIALVSMASGSKVPRVMQNNSICKMDLHCTLYYYESFSLVSFILVHMYM